MTSYSWFVTRRTAILSGLLSAVAFVQAGLRQAAPEGVGPNTYAAVLLLGAIGFGVTGYVAAYQAIGLQEKILFGALVGGLSSVGAGILARDTAAEIALATILVVGVKLGIEFALPSKGIESRNGTGVPERV